MGLFAKLTRHKTVEQLQAEAGTNKDFRRVMGIKHSKLAQET